MIKSYITIEVNSKSPILRERAITVLGRYSRLEFGAEINVSIAREILAKIEDEDLPVRIASCCNLVYYLRKPEVKAALIEQLPFMLEKFLGLMDEMDHEELVSSLEELVNEYSENIGPYAL